MKTYDVVVVGAGDVGLAIAFPAAAAKLSVALIDKGQVGGTCTNYGCVPSKTLLYTADRIAQIRDASKFGIRADIKAVDFNAVMGRMRKAVLSGRKGIQGAIEDTENIDFFPAEAQFADDRTLAVGEERIRGKKIFLASGARPAIPPIKGLETIPYLTNETVLDLEKRPETMAIIGGSYVSLEFAHFFASFGTRVTIIKRESTLLPFTEPEIGDLMRKEMEARTELLAGFNPFEVRRTQAGCAVSVRDNASGSEKVIEAEVLFVAAGRKSNADLLKVENAGIEKDSKDYIKVDDYLQTNKKHIWAVGDATGKAMFTHAGDKEAELAWHNAMHNQKRKMDFGVVPYALFTRPQIAGVGMTEEQGRREREVLVGRAMYSDTVMGEAMLEDQGFAKAIVEKETGKILGFHIIGPEASNLIQEVVNAMINNHNVQSITGSMHIFPALSNLIPEVLGKLE